MAESSERYEREAGYVNPNQFVFTSKSGGALSYTTTLERLSEIAIKMGRADLTPHTLRHTYMTVATRCGEKLDEIRNRVGHVYDSLTIQEYLHLTEDSLHEAAIRRHEYLEKLLEKYEKKQTDG